MFTGFAVQKKGRGAFRAVVFDEVGLGGDGDGGKTDAAKRSGFMRINCLYFNKNHKINWVKIKYLI
jgi:hypothetical protein